MNPRDFFIGTSWGLRPSMLTTSTSRPVCLVKAYMLHGAESKQVTDLVSDHDEKKFLRNLLMALQAVEDGTRRGGKGQTRGGQFRQVCTLFSVELSLASAALGCLLCPPPPPADSSISRMIDILDPGNLGRRLVALWVVHASTWSMFPPSKRPSSRWN